MSEREDPVVARRARRACQLALAALALIVWSMLDPRPIPVIVAMSVGQVIGTLSLVMFAFAIIADLHARFVARRETPKPKGD